jgi:hypothetical protein
MVFAQNLLQAWYLGAVRAHLGAPARQLMSENLRILMKTFQMFKSGINIQVFAMKSRPDTDFSKRIRWWAR